MGTTNFFDGKRPQQFITNGSIASNFTSNPIECLLLDRVGLEFTWTTADVNGTLYIQGTITGNVFQNLPSTSPTVISIAIAGVSGSQIFDIDCKAFSKIQAFFSRTSGTAGTLNGWWLAKGTI